MHVVAAADQDGLTGYRRESVVVRIFEFLGDFDTAKHFMNMPLHLALVVSKL